MVPTPRIYAGIVLIVVINILTLLGVNGVIIVTAFVLQELKKAR
jgi:hypothetical protein